jgi:hypothetical protein
MRLRLLDHASITTAHGLRIVGFFRREGGPTPDFDSGVITPPTLGVAEAGPRSSIQETHAVGRGPRYKLNAVYLYIEQNIKINFLVKIGVTGVTV